MRVSFSLICAACLLLTNSVIAQPKKALKSNLPTVPESSQINFQNEAPLKPIITENPPTKMTSERGLDDQNIAVPIVTTLDEMLLLRLHRLGEVVVAPDAKTILFSVSTPDFTANKSETEVYSMTIGASGKTLIIPKEYAASSPKFRPDGKKIGFLTAKTGVMQLWECDLNGSNPHAVSTNTKEDIEGFKYSPDGKKIAFFKTVQIETTIKQRYPDLPKVSEDARIIDGLNYRHWKTWEDGAYSHIFIADYTDGKLNEASAKDLMLGEAFDCPNPPDNGEEDLIWSPDSQFLVYACKKETATAYAVSTDVNLYCYNLQTSKTTNLTSINKGYDQQPSFSPDGSLLAWQSMQRAGYESDKNRVMVASFNKGVLGEPLEITKSIDLTSTAYAWSATGKNVYVIFVERGTKQIYSFDTKGGTSQVLTQGAYDYNAINPILINGKEQLVATRCSMLEPNDLYLISTTTSSQGAVKITMLNDELLQNQLKPTVQKRMVKITDGKEELCWVIYPPNFNPTKKYPTLLYCQGGPQSPVSQFWSYRWNFSLMASKGYIIIAPNRRGLQGFGQAWNDAIQADYGGQCMRDLLSAADDIAKENYIDKDKMAAVGASFGGYSVYWLMGNHKKRFKTFIAHCGMFNMESWYGTTEELFFANHDQKGAYWENPAAYVGSPHRFVQNWDTPLLVIHNEKDFRVPIGEGMQAFTAAQLKGLKSRFLYLPDEGHHVSKPQNAILWQRTFYAWLTETLK